MDEVSLLLPDKKGVPQGRKYEAGQYLPGAGVFTQEAEAMGQQEHPEAEDGQTFDQSTKPGGTGRGQPQDEVDAGRFEERHQLRALALDHRDRRNHLCPVIFEMAMVS